MVAATHPTFWDVDTQVDFIMPEGKLYIPGAEETLPNLQRLTEYARGARLLVLGSCDYHSSDDPELSEAPDFDETYPEHCLAGTPGQAKVDETAPENALWIDSEPWDRDRLETRVRAHTGEIYLRKQRFDVFSNPNTVPLLETLGPRRLVVYGVALDVCDAHAIEGLLRLGSFHVSLVLDATRAIRPERGDQLVEDWRGRGVSVVTTADVVSGAVGA